MSDQDEHKPEPAEAKPPDPGDTPTIAELDVPIRDLDVPFGGVTRADIAAAKERSK